MFVLLLLGLLLASPGANAQGTKGSPPGAPAAGAKAGPQKPIKLRGEILDLGCFLSHGLRGSMHRDCALKCLSAGVPMGVITADSVVYLITQVHGRAMNPDSYQIPNAFELCKQWPSQTVDLSGFAYERDGVRILEVSKAALVPPAATGSPQ
jgi:hypothetical protein